MSKKDYNTTNKNKIKNKIKRIKNGLEEDKENLAFNFTIFSLIIASKCQISRKASITLTKISGDLNFLQKSIKNLSSTLKLVKSKNSPITKEIKNILLS